MFKKKAVETMYNGSKDDGFSLEQWQQDSLSGNDIEKLVLNILDPTRQYVLVNTCPDLYVGIKESSLILKTLAGEGSSVNKMVKDSSITFQLQSGVLAITAYDLGVLVMIWVALNPGAYIAVQTEGDVALNKVEI